MVLVSVQSLSCNDKQKKKRTALLGVIAELESKVDQNRGQDKHTQHSGTKAIVIGTRQTLADPVRAPVERCQCIDHDHHGHKREHAGRDAADTVAKVEQANAEGSQEDCEVEPGQEGALVGEKDFGLDTDRKGDALAGGGLQQRLIGRWRGHRCGVNVLS